LLPSGNSELFFDLVCLYRQILPEYQRVDFNVSAFYYGKLLMAGATAKHKKKR